MKQQGTMRDYVNAAIQARQPSGACLGEEQVVAFYSGQLPETEMEAVRDHLAECPTCLALAQEARQFVHAMSEPAQAVAAASASALPWQRAHRHALFLMAASVIIAVGIVLLLWRGWRVEAPSDQQGKTPPAPTQLRENPWRGLQIAKADYTPEVARPADLIWRDERPETPGRPRPSPFARAMRPYEQNNFAQAEQRLGLFLEKNPAHAGGYFYRGVSLLLLGRTADAIAPLETAIELGQGQVREEAQWYLALAYLKAGGLSRALTELDAVIKTSGKHRAEALQLRQQIREALGQ